MLQSLQKTWPWKKEAAAAVSDVFDCVSVFFLFPPHDLNYVRSGKSRKENREDNEHLVFKTFTSDCRDRTNMLPCCRNTQKSAPQRKYNPRKKDEHHETHPVVGWLLCWSGCVGVNVHTGRNTCVSASLSREIENIYIRA